MSALLAALAGLLFAAGLTLSGMTSPARVIGFLDVLGDWDPQLAFVMGGALATYAVLYRVIRRRFPSPALDAQYHLPAAARPDARVVLGAGLFGVGWGMMGLCPGPALVSAGAGKLQALVFVGAMGAGMVLVKALGKARAQDD